MPIADLPVTAIEVKTATIDFKLPWVTAPTPLLTGEINHMIAQSAGLEAMYANAGNASTKGSVTCEIGVATTILVSWACSENVERPANYEGGAMPGGRFGRTVVIEKGHAKDVGVGDLFFGLDSLTCITKDDAMFVQADGVETNGTWNGNGGNPSPAICNASYDDLQGHLGSTLEAIAPGKRSPVKIVWPAVSDRFLVTGDVVHDNLTNLDWSAHDNGADIAYDAAAAYAAASKLGGKTDWRIPREAEVESLISYVGTHKEPTDCTHGKSRLLIVSEIHPSCGILWTSTSIDDRRAVTVGLISGGARLQSEKAKTHSRVLLVRSH